MPSCTDWEGAFHEHLPSTSTVRRTLSHLWSFHVACVKTVYISTSAILKERLKLEASHIVPHSCGLVPD
jgi:hypothetical protein